MRLILTQPTSRSGDGEADIRSVAELIEPLNLRLAEDDILVLPELIGGEMSDERYATGVRWLARTLSVHVVGGSHHSRCGPAVVNRGIVVDPSGEEVAKYEKARPYGAEVRLPAAGGAGGGSFRIGDVSIHVLICSDFWYWSSFEKTGTRPDVVVVPAFSVSQRALPDIARARWRNAAVARAYDLPAFVGISDWAYPTTGLGGKSCGAAGFAHPIRMRPGVCFAPSAKGPPWR